MPAENTTVYGVCNSYSAVEIITVTLHYSVSKKTAPTLLAVTRESIVGFS